MSGIGTIPDAFVIRPDLNKWYVIEVELASHNAYHHILPQVQKIRSALQSGPLNRSKLSAFFDGEVDSDIYKYSKWVLATGEKQNIHRRIDKILQSEPDLIIIIDDTNQQLLEIAPNFGFKTKINTFKCFKNENGDSKECIFQFDTLEIQNTIVTKPTSAQTTPVTKPVSLTSSASNTAQNRTVTNHTPSALDWSLSIHELAQVNGLTQWSKICNHLGVRFEGDSARRALARWVKVEKPNWPPVP